MAGGLDSIDGIDQLDGLINGSSAGADDDLDGFQTFEDLTPFEVEHFVQELQMFELGQVGDRRWLTQHERVEKLNWTAHNQAKEGLDEYVVDQLNTLEKVPTLVFDLMLIEVWKERIWPLVKAKIAKFSSLRTYIPVYHEASVANLLEVALFHRTTCEEAGDALVDLVDWCVRKFRHLLATPNHELVRQVTSAKEFAEWDSVRALDEQFVECEFQVCMCAISIVRFLTDHRVAVPLAVTTRLLETHDVLLLLVPLMEKAPWVRKNRINGRIQKFEEHEWQDVEADDEGRLPKLHSQLWLAIYNLVMDGECRSRYELTSFRRENLLRLRRYINEVVIDQLPPLTNLHRTLEELSISGQFTGAGNTPAPTPFVVELVAEARESILRTYDGQWQDVADAQLRDVLVKETPEELKKLGGMVSVPKHLLEDPPEQPGDREGGAGATAAAAPAWEAVAALPLVRSTASFFAATRAGDSSAAQEVVVLTAPPQAAPGPGDRLRLELRRAPRGQFAGRPEIGALTAEAFLLTVEAPGGSSVGSVRVQQYVSQKGASKRPAQLVDLLSKPGREELLKMYSEDTAEFTVPVAAADGDEGLELRHVAGLALPAA